MQHDAAPAEPDGAAAQGGELLKGNRGSARVSEKRVWRGGDGPGNRGKGGGEVCV